MRSEEILSFLWLRTGDVVHIHIKNSQGQRNYPSSFTSTFVTLEAESIAITQVQIQTPPTDPYCHHELKVQKKSLTSFSSGLWKMPVNIISSERGNCDPQMKWTENENGQHIFIIASTEAALKCHFLPGRKSYSIRRKVQESPLVAISQMEDG